MSDARRITAHNVQHVTMHPISEAPVNPPIPVRGADAAELSLLLRVGRRELPALEELHRVFSPRLYAVALRMTGDEGEAAEALQDTLVRIWEKAPEYDPVHAAPFTWMYLLLRGICWDRLRRSGREQTRRGPMPANMEARLPDPRCGPAEAAHYRDVVTTIKSAIGSLAPRDRSLLERVVLGHGSVREAAVENGESEGAVKVRLHRALRKLRELILHLHED